MTIGLPANFENGRAPDARAPKEKLFPVFSFAACARPLAFRLQK